MMVPLLCSFLADGRACHGDSSALEAVARTEHTVHVPFITRPFSVVGTVTCCDREAPSCGRSRVRTPDLDADDRLWRAPCSCGRSRSQQPTAGRPSGGTPEASQKGGLMATSRL